MSASGLGATEKLADLFEQRQGIAVSRARIQQVASQLDALKRLRRNGGARDILDRKGIALLWGKGDCEVIGQLGLGPVLDNEFISYTPKNQAELALLRRKGHSDLSAPPGL